MVTNHTCNCSGEVLILLIRPANSQANTEKYPGLHELPLETCIFITSTRLLSAVYRVSQFTKLCRLRHKRNFVQNFVVIIPYMHSFQWKKWPHEAHEAVVSLLFTLKHKKVLLETGVSLFRLTLIPSGLEATAGVNVTWAWPLRCLLTFSLRHSTLETNAS